MLHTASHSLVLVAIVMLVPLALYVIRALWVTMQTISEQRHDPSPAAPLLLTAGMVAMTAAFAYVAYLTQIGGAA